MKRDLLFKRTQEIETHLEMTPLIDTVFLLLIFFMLTSTFIVQPGIKIKLPLAKTAGSQTKKDLVITITQDNLIYLNGKKINIKNLPQKLKMEKEVSRKDLLIIKADKQVRHGKVVEIMDIAREAGMEKLAIATKPKRK